MRRVSVHSLSRNRVLWKDCDFAESGFERAVGIMFRPRLERPFAIPFSSAGRKRNSIHSVFCPPFDAAFLCNGKVVDVRQRVPPNQPLIVSAKTCDLVLELPPGESRKTRLGEKLSLK